MAQSLVTDWPESANRLAQRFWPGPLTLVLEKQMAIPSIVTAGLPTVGLRMPAHPMALALIRGAGIPLAAPSANRFTQLSPTTAEHVKQALGTDVDLILDGGPCKVGIESTVLSLAGPQPVLLRPGAIARHEIESVIGPITTTGNISDGAHPAPGMHPRHYSPRTRLVLVKNGEVPGNGSGVYLQYQHAPTRSGINVVQMPSAVAEYAAALYSRMHEADAAGYDWIAVDMPTMTPEWVAIHDRLKHASSEV
jgi:L-threonylcarbamoyladenylate synthase